MSSAAPAESAAAASSSAAAPASWFWDDPSQTYKSVGDAPPDCPTPLIEKGALTNISKVKSKSQPGQLRDGEYLINGTYRWSSQGQPYPKKIVVKMPFDGYVTGAWQFKKGGAPLFGVNLVHPCGLMLRLSKMATPSADFKAKVLDQLPPAQEMDSRETFFTPGIWLPKGTPIATSVGIGPPNAPDLIGAVLDIAIVDLRAPNPQIPSDFQGPQAAPQYLYYGHCFYQGGYLSKEEETFVAKLPITNKNPKSDTCVAS